jgi:hypothetical protein
MSFTLSGSGGSGLRPLIGGPNRTEPRTGNPEPEPNPNRTVRTHDRGGIGRAVNSPRRRHECRNRQDLDLADPAAARLLRTRGKRCADRRSRHGNELLRLPRVSRPVFGGHAMPELLGLSRLPPDVKRSQARFERYFTRALLQRLSHWLRERPARGSAREASVEIPRKGDRKRPDGWGVAGDSNHAAHNRRSSSVARLLPKHCCRSVTPKFGGDFSKNPGPP